MLRLTQGLLGVLASLLLVGCGAPADPAPSTESSEPRSPDLVFEDTMDNYAAGWRNEFAVEGATTQDAPTLAILAAKTTCSDLENHSVEEVLLNLLSGVLPSDTAGTLLYAATVAYCPTYTQAVQDFTEANR